ncbi:MAG: hypothetical protein ABSC01_07770 [Verrucomicrobiota bacterium]|jgi:hypothetical protein
MALTVRFYKPKLTKIKQELGRETSTEILLGRLRAMNDNEQPNEYQPPIGMAVIASFVCFAFMLCVAR